MGRARRIQFAGACYYIVLEGNNRQDLFLSNQDRRQFLSFLRAHKARYGLKVYAYCLLDHEAHLVLETSQPNLSLVMQGFNTLYTKYFNAAHNSSGHLFGGRYKALLVDPQAALAETTRFVHLLPLRAGLKEKPWRYPWSSCSAYVESEQGESLVDSEAVLARFAKVRLKQSVRYLQYIKDRMKSAAELRLPVLKGLAVGDEAFLARLQAPAPPRPQAAEQARRILSEVAARHGFQEEKLLGPSRWRELSSVRRRAIYRIWKETGMGVTELGRLFKRTPSAVSQLVKSFEAAGQS